MTTAAVITEIKGGRYELYTSDGETVYGVARGLLRHEGVHLLAGDRVELREPTDGSDEWIICGTEERDNALIRPPVANISLLCAVISALAEPTDIYNADKLIASAENLDIPVAVAVTKSDLAPDESERIASVYRLAGFEVFQSGVGLPADTERLKAYLRDSGGGGSRIFAGVSGAGKSTLMNMMYEGLCRKTSQLGPRSTHGRNTTREVKLYPLSALDRGEGFIADTPGFSMLDFVAFDFFVLENTELNFREFAPYLGKCRYTKCSHRTEEGCAVIAAVEDGRISPSRHASYIGIYDELKSKNGWRK